nr:hypothetical protein [Tanacetum cinerariifolium]
MQLTQNLTNSAGGEFSVHGNESGKLNSSHIGNIPSPMSFANLVKSDSRRKTMNFRLMFTAVGNGVDDGLIAIATKLGNPLMLDSYMDAMCTDSRGRDSFARAMVELKSYIMLRDTIVVVVPKFSGEGFILSTIRVEYARASPRCYGCKVFGHVLGECPKKIASDILKNSKMSRQPTCGPPIGLKPKSTFVYRLIFTKNQQRLMGI